MEWHDLVNPIRTQAGQLFFGSTGWGLLSINNLLYRCGGVLLHVQQNGGDAVGGLERQRVVGANHSLAYWQRGIWWVFAK